MLHILKISLVTYIFKLNSLKSATKALNLASFKEIQWEIILVWNVGLYLNIQYGLSSLNVRTTVVYRDGSSHISGGAMGGHVTRSGGFPPFFRFPALFFFL